MDSSMAEKRAVSMVDLKAFLTAASMVVMRVAQMDVKKVAEKAT